MEKAEGTQYRDELLSKIVLICSQNTYQFITSFEWYVTVLIELGQQEFGQKQGKVLSQQLVDVCVRVHGIRQFAVSELTQLIDQHALNACTGSTMHEVLYAAAWICGEFCLELAPQQIEHAIENMLVYINLPSHIHAVFIQNILKMAVQVLRTYAEEERWTEIQDLCRILSDAMTEYVKSAELEVQERASTSLLIIKIVGETVLERNYFIYNIHIFSIYVFFFFFTEIQASPPKSDVMAVVAEESETSVPPDNGMLALIEELQALFEGDLNPVAPKAQRKVPVPDGLDLDVWINPPAEDAYSSPSEPEDMDDIFLPKHHERVAPGGDRGRGGSREKGGAKESQELSWDEINKVREARRQEQLNNPHYLKSSVPKKKNSSYENDDDDNDVPVLELNLSVPLRVSVGNEKRSDRYLNIEKQRRKSSNKKGSGGGGGKGKRGKKSSSRRQQSNNSSDELDDDVSDNSVAGGDASIVVNQSLDMPEGATFSDDSLSSRGGGALDDPHRALNIDLDT